MELFFNRALCENFSISSASRCGAVEVLTVSVRRSLVTHVWLFGSPQWKTEPVTVDQQQMKFDLISDVKVLDESFRSCFGDPFFFLLLSTDSVDMIDQTHFTAIHVLKLKKKKKKKRWNKTTNV